jgi:hypothetical protein
MERALGYVERYGSLLQASCSSSHGLPWTAPGERSVAMRFRIWLATAVELSALASSRRSRRFAGAFPSLISISS